jgi:hypothetical protein
MATVYRLFRRSWGSQELFNVSIAGDDEAVRWRTGHTSER